MVIRNLTTVAVPSLALLLLSGGIANAGYVCQKATLNDDTAFVIGVVAGSRPVRSWSRSSRQKVVVEINDRPERPMRTIPRGALPTEMGASRGCETVGLLEPDHPTAIAMAGWIGAEGRMAIPPHWSAGVFRPPR